ncbi:exodeoxyribonuclease VII large subunit [Salipiger sp. IMCC34102]|uniref:exodeoxyribonuclease VII large subunit n=1 Tax=Salipiger sp. IMCC34102 TaxID=2510647 RepID=UPI00101B5E41|nr:exodeoxyribonuclease VII large subunit [Salipiger sp. IMCC34102]RYH02376.1 exodeoxyribonuclease VII large subunit [Salipiger sp. IMCC34102]
MDLFEDASADNVPEFSVSEISGAVKKAIEGGFGHVRVRGEVGRVSRPRSGHVYLDLKDDRSVLSGIIWKGRAQALPQQPEEGMEVVATGKLTTFPGQSKYQIIIEDIAPAGAGALMAMLEKRKAALAAEGLFAAERKRPLPYLPEIIGVVTSPSGAVIRDILHRLQDRFPRKVLVWPVAVQGAKCAPEVAAAIAGFNAMTPGGALPRPDLLIVARGGGSIEDLWGFNEEVVARAAAASEIPLISAVGHETDTTLIDFVSDRRAPTPTAAAEIAVPVRSELRAMLDQSGARISRAVAAGLDLRAQRLRDLGRVLPQPDALLQGPRQRLDFLAERLPGALRAAASKKRVRLAEAGLKPGLLSRGLFEERRRLDGWAARLDPALRRRLDSARRELTQRRLPLPDLGPSGVRLESLSKRLSDLARRDLERRRDRLTALDRVRESVGYKETLKRGYAVVRADGRVVVSSDGVRDAQRVEIEFAGDDRIEIQGDPQGRLF